MNRVENVNNSSLLEQIRSLSFVKTELELYLDTHPNCAAALDYYTRTVDERDGLMRRYHETQGPLFASGVTGDNGWSWVQMPWPWQHGAGKPEKTED